MIMNKTNYFLLVLFFSFISVYGTAIHTINSSLTIGALTKDDEPSDKKPVFVPTFSNCPSDILNVMPNSGDCTAVVTWTPPTASGSGPVTISSNYSPGDAFYPGSHRVIYRATDSNGTSFCEFIVQVNDTQPPTITVPANITRTADPGLCGAVVNFPFPTAADNCPAGQGAPIDQNFDSGTDLSTQCYRFDGTLIGTTGQVNGSVGELETVELINNDIRTFTSPLTKFNGTGEIFFDHRILAGSPSGNIGNDARLTVKLITTGGVETVIFTEDYVDENVQTEYIEITQNGNFFVQFEWETSQNRSDIAYLDNLYIPGFVVSDTTVVTCGVSFHRVVQIAGFPYRSGREFPVGTTTLEYVSRDAAGNIGFNSFTVTVTNNINPPAGNDVSYCEGTPVPQISVTVGAGETADWYDAAVGGTLLRSGSTTYTPPGPGNYYAETRNTSTGCVSGSRRRIRVIENPQPTAPSAASPIEYCLNDTAVPLTATGDPGNMIDWYDAPTGGTMYATAPTPDTSVAGSTSYYVEQVDATTLCISPRTEVVVTVYSLPTAPTVDSPVEYCIGDASVALDTHATGTNLRWYTAATGGTEIPGSTQPDTSTAGQQFYWVTQSASSGSQNCESLRTRLTVNVNTPPTITTQPTNRAVCEDGSTTFVVAASNAGSFQWQLFNGTSWDDLTNTTFYTGTTTNTLAISNADISLNGSRYRAVASSPAASCSEATSNSVTLTVNPAPLPPTSGGDQTECEENPVQTLTASATPPSGSTVVWYDTASGGNIVTSPTLNAVGTITYYAESQNGTTSCVSTSRTAVTLTIQSAPSAPTSGGDQTECEQAPLQTLTATATAPSGATVVWYDSATGGNLVSNPILNTVGTITYYAQSENTGTGCPSNSRTAVALTILPAPSAPISGGNQTECRETPTQTLTAMATVGSGESIRWFDAPTGGTVVTAPTLSSVGTVTYYAESQNTTSTCASTSRTPVTLTIEDIPVAPTSGGDQTECETNPTQTMTATATAPAGSTVVWYDAASAGNTVAPTLSSVGTITYYAESRTTSSGCVSNTRTAVTLTMNPRPTIAITPASQSCSPDLATYAVSVDVNRGTVTASEGTVTDNGGNNWTISGITSGNNITVTVTDTNTCSESIAVNAPNCACPTVNAPTSGGNQTECELNPIQTLTATATPPAGASVVWYDTATGGNVVTSPTLNSVASVTYYAESVDTVNSCTSSTRTPVTLTLQAAPVAAISGGDQAECEISPTQTLTATATSASGTTIVWYDAATGGSIVSSPTLNTVGTITYFAEVRDNGTNCPSFTRTAVSLTIQPNPVAPTSGGNQTECEASPIQTLTATAFAPSGSSVVWYDAASGGSMVSSPTLSTIGTITFYAESVNGTTSCTSTTRTPVSLTLRDTPDISISSAPACASDLLTYAVSVNVSEGTVTSTEGTVTDNGGNNWTISGITAGNNTTLTVTATNTCTQTLSITAPDCSCPVVNAPVSGGDQTECENSTLQTLTATATPPANATIVWFDAASGGNTVGSPTLNSVGTVTYYAESRQNITNCPSSTRTAVQLTIQPVPAAPTSGGNQTECEASPIQTLTASATAPSGSTVLWYDAPTGGNVVSSPTLNTVGTITYYASSASTTTSCTSFSRTAVSLTIQDTPDITISSAATCATDLLTYAVSVNVSEGTVTSTEGTVTDNGGNNWTISGITAGNNITLTVTATNTCTQTLPITAPDCSCPVIDAPTSGGNQTECENAPVQTLTASATPPANTTIVWYDAASGGTVVGSPTLNTVGTVTYYAESVENVTNCTSSTRTPVTLTIQATPTAPVSGGDQTECDANPTQTLTATATAPAGASVVWYDAASAGNVVASPILDAVGSVTYYAESRNTTTSCTSFSRTAVSLTINALPNVVANATTTNINAGEPVTLTGSGATFYTWDNGVTDGDTVFPLVTTTYTVIGTDSNGCDNMDSVTIVVGATSDLRLDKIVDVATPNVGDTVAFTLTTTNDGPSDDTGGSIVTDILPVGYTYVSDTGNAANGSYNPVSGVWTLPAIANGSSISLTIRATVNAPTGVADEFRNTAQVTAATNFDSDSSPNNDDGDQSEDDEASVSTVPQVIDLSVINSISLPSANPGDALTLTVAVTNNGPEDATNVRLENIVPIGFMVTTINDLGVQSGNSITWDGLSIPSGTSIAMSFDVTVNNPTLTIGEYLNTVQVTTADQYDLDSTPNNDDGDQSEDDEDAILFVLQSTDLEIVNTVSPGSGNPGDALTFMVEVINKGTDDATNVAIENYVPSGFTVTAINDGGAQTGNTISWSGLNVPNGTTLTMTFEVTINVPTNTAGEYVNTVQVVGVDQLDPNSTPNNDDGDQSEDDEDNAEIVLIPADLSLSKALSSASNATPNAGDTVTFEITATNEGPGIATNVTIVDTLPIGYTLETVNNNGTVSGNTIVWNIPSMAMGTQTMTYAVTLNAPTNTLGEYTNTAQITTSDQFDPDSAPNNDDGDQSEDDEARHMIDPPTVDLAIDKTINKAETFFEDTIVFTVTATNNSTYEATNIGIEDVLPSGYVLVSHTSDLGVYNETTSTWEIPSIPIGATATLEMTVTVTEIDDYTNVAQLIYVDQIDLNMDNDRAEATPIVTQAQCFTIFNEFTPNNDGLNDVFFIECIENYPNNNVKVFNRWGNQVFEMNNYDNSWDGTSMGTATINAREKLPVGTYYYLIDFGDGSEPKTGWLYITR